MPVAVSVAFERLSLALEAARRLPRDDAILVLHDAATTLEPGSELMRWFLHEVAVIVSTEDDGA